MATEASQADHEFDFEAHGASAQREYQAVRPLYEAFAVVLERILEQALAARDINAASVEVRAKSLASFAAKAAMPSDTDPQQPKYQQPLQQITDLTAARVITFFRRTVSTLDNLLSEEFQVIERLDKSAALLREDRLGYQSVHYLVKLGPARTALPEYRRFADLVAEVQVRTILQHAWAEIEHDIQYKSVETIPTAIRHRFTQLAGLLEIADREFQAIQDADESIRQEARRSVKEGQLQRVEITADALKSYLDGKLGADGRITLSAYEYEARQLRRIGFGNFQQIDEYIAGLDDDKLSRIATDVRQGQLTRFEILLLASIGQAFIDAKGGMYVPVYYQSLLDRLLHAGIKPRGLPLPTSEQTAIPSAV